jgi:iron complex outermembrane recepter protein
MRNGHIRTSAAVAMGLAIMGPGGAWSQDTAGGSEESIQEVVVTGTRIKRSGSFDSAVPIAVLDGDTLRNSGFTVLGEAMANLPQALVNSNIQNTSGTLFNAGQSRVDLRGLGSNRTLVLLDGRRALTGDFRSPAVDLNLIPSTMIERIEAISGGASAVYGSEAIAGVVNVVLRKDYDGIDFDASGGMTEEEDGEEWKGAVGYGTKFADGRGSFVIGAEMGKVEPIYQVDRDWAFPGIRRNTLVTPSPIVPASRTNLVPTATFQLVSTTTVATARSVSIAPDRSAINVNTTECRTNTVRPLCQDPWLFEGAVFNVLQGSQERQTLRTYVDFDLTDSLKLFADLSYGKAEGQGYSTPAFSSAAGGGTMPVVIRGDNAYLNGSSPLAAPLRTEWQAAGLALTSAASVNVGKFWVEFGNRNTVVDRETYRAVTGLNGQLQMWDRDIDWDVYAQYSELDGSATASGTPIVSRVQQAVDSNVVNGQIVCATRVVAGQTVPPEAGCVPWDILNGPSPAALAWASATARADGLASQAVFGANLTTSLFELPAGPLGFAAGVEYRKEESDHRQDALSAANRLFYNAIGQTKGEYDLTEGYMEAVVPVLADLPFAHRLSIEAAGRIGEYSTVGSVDQWRLQATWAPIQDLSVRASTSRAVRAPNITELYGPRARNFAPNNVVDPCENTQVSSLTNATQRQQRIANCAQMIPNYDPATFISNIGSGRPSLPTIAGGNADLSEEAADTYSVGLVVRPRWVRDFSFSADYWNITVDDAISTIPPQTLLTNLCYNSPDGTTSNRFCQMINRDQTGAQGGGRVGGLIEIVQTSQNVQSIETSGVDAAVEYTQDLRAAGRLQLRVDATKVIRWDLQGGPRLPITHFAGVLTQGIPEYKANGAISWMFRDLTLQWQTRYLDSFAVSEIRPATVTPLYTGGHSEHDLRASFRWSDELNLRVGIINVTNEEPPAVPEVGNATLTGPSAYDNRGRWFYVGAHYSFGTTR